MIQLHSFAHGNPQQNISKPNSTIMKRIIHCDQVEYFQRGERCFNICKFISVIHHINQRIKFR